MKDQRYCVNKLRSEVQLLSQWCQFVPRCPANCRKQTHYRRLSFHLVEQQYKPLSVFCLLFSALSLSTPTLPFPTSSALLLRSLLPLNEMKFVLVCILVVYLLTAVHFHCVMQRQNCFLGLPRRPCECENGTSFIVLFQQLVLCSRSNQSRRILDVLKTLELGLVLARRGTKTSISLNSATSFVVLVVSSIDLVLKGYPLWCL